MRRVNWVLLVAMSVLTGACNDTHVLEPDEKVTDDYCTQQMGEGDGCGACVAQCGYCYTPEAPLDGRCLAPAGEPGSNSAPRGCSGSGEVWAAIQTDCPGPPALTGPE